jgi:two-component system, sensor histidine kinase RpfC
VWVVAASLAAYAMLAPLAVAALAGPSPVRGFGTIVLATILLGPGLATILVCWRGLSAIARDLAERADEEPNQAILRIYVSAALLAYIGAVAAAGGAGERLPPLVAIYVGFALAAWLVLLHCMIVPASALRRAASLVADTLVLSLFLHWGDAVAAPWIVLYLALTLDHGLRFGAGALVAAALANTVGFAAVVATTPVWRAMPLADLALFVALGVLPLYGAALLRRVDAARREAMVLRAGRGRLLAVLSHELRAPLTTLIGVGALLARTRPDAAQREMVATVQLAARTLLGLINDLLDPARLEEGEATQRSESFVLREVLGGACAILRPQLEARGLELSLVVDPRLPHVCKGLPLQLRQLLMNLLANAIAETPRSNLAVNATLVEREPGQVRLRLVVQAERTGAAPAERGGGFFAPAEEPGSPDGGDGALGLAIADALVEQMDGTLLLNPEVGSATIEIALGCDEEAAALPPDLTGRRLALVTRDRELADRLQTWLKAWRGETQWYADGEDALTVLGGAARHVVVIDGRHDPLGGLSLAHRLATASPHPTILFLAPPQASAAVAGLAATQLGAVIEEPVTETALANALLSVLAATGAEPDASPSRLTLLVADDNPDTRERLKSILERAGHRVELASDGGAALAALDKGGVDGALLDLDMPGVSGDAVAKLHRLRHPASALPLIALAADASAATDARCREAGFDAALTKPADAAQLVAAIDAARAARTASARAPAPDSPDVTPISSHPRFLGEGAEIVREATIESLRGLGGNEFVAEVVETFRNDANRLVARLRHAAQRSDLAQFAELAHSLRSGAANIGGVRLCQTLTALEDLTHPELRQAGMAYVEKIESELARLDLALEPFARAQRRG